MHMQLLLRHALRAVSPAAAALTCRALVAMLATALALLLAAPAHAQLLADPRVPWFSADSAHFRVHYRDGHRAQAEQVARAAERVYPRITGALQWQPRGRTEIVLYSELDQANGFTTPLPFNKIGVFLAPPDSGELLDNSAWLDLLLVHEFTHAVHLDKVRGVPRVLQSIFGRVLWFIPNLFQPGWVSEGLAVHLESDPAQGIGRLQGPIFEAWLRAERAAGFLPLAEINADGRALPLAKQYLYGAYFFEFLARRYGADKVGAYVEQYSGNIVPRLHTNPFDMTGKTMDALWDEFLADLAQQVDTRAAPIRAQPEVLGPRLAGPLLAIPTVAALPDGALLAVIEDGLHGAQLVRLQTDGTQRVVTRVNRDARVTVGADGRVLITQPDICNTLYYVYDAYRLEGERLVQLTDCARLRRAVPAGDGIAALQLHEGAPRLVRLDAEGRNLQVLHTPADGSELVDLAASPDGRRISVISRRGADWQLLAFDAANPQAAPRLLLRRSAPMQGLRHGAAGIELLLAEGGVYNVWRLQGGALQRLTHSHTAVVAHAGTAADGALATVVIAPQGVALHRLAAPASLQSLVVDAAPAASVAAAPSADVAEPVLGEASSYSALRSVYPRSWLPAITNDRGLSAYGAATNGGDALGWHQYAALVQWETSQKELLGSVAYIFAESHSITLSRTLAARAWTGDKGDEKTTVYDRHTKAQWISLLPITRVQRRIALGVGAALDRIERVDLPGGNTLLGRDRKLAAALFSFDTRADDWLSEGPNRGASLLLLGESYKPFANRDANAYDGQLLRADLRGHLPLGRSVLALRWTEVRASGRTAPFQLGGATDEVLQTGVELGVRTLSLRGYRGDETALTGRNARVASVEWRTALADIDRHGMVPPLGVNRLSAALFVDVGGAWTAGGAPAQWHRGVGVELLAETKLLYLLPLQLRLGLARALDEPKGTRGYLTLGRAF